MADEKQKPAQSDPWEEAAKSYQASGAQSPSAPAGDDDWKVWQQNGAVPAEETPLQKIGHAFEDAGIGALKGAGSTANSIGKLLYPDFIAKHLTGAPTEEQQQGYFAPKNTAQAVGKGIEQAGEFLVPGGAEEMGAEKLASLAPRLGKAAAPLAKVFTAGVGSGLVNKAQGGNFATGAVAGSVGSGIGQGLRAVAPAVAESALNIRKMDRAYKQPGAIGKAILEETKGFGPSTIAESAQGKLDQLNPQLEAAAAKATTPADLQGPRDELAKAAFKATKQGERTTVGQLQPMVTHLTEDIAGNPLPATLPATDLLDLKRGFGNEFIHRWNPETMTGVKGTAGRTYHAMGQEFNRVVPEGAELNSRISNLIPVAKRAESLELNAPTGQRVLQRFGAHTGALAGGLFGANEGYREHGLPGAIAGGLVGTVAPEMIASPTGQMVLARGMSSAAPALAKAFTGWALQFSKRPNDDDDKKKKGGND